MATNLDDLFAMAESEAGASGEREAGGYYNPEGDCIQFYNVDVPYRRDRVDELLTLYKALDDGRVIGFQLKGISQLPPEVEAIGVDHTPDEVMAIGLVSAVMFTFASRYPTKAVHVERGHATLGRYMEAARVVPQASFTRDRVPFEHEPV